MSGPTDLQVPSIPRARVQEFIRAVGFDPAQVADFRCEARDLVVTVYAQHPEHGGRYVSPGTNGVMTVTHRLRLVNEET